MGQPSQTVEKVVSYASGQMICTGICSNEKLNVNVQMERNLSKISLHCLLFANLNSTVQPYADEFKLSKYNFLFRTLPACRYFIDTPGATFVAPIFMRINRCRATNFKKGTVFFTVPKLYN